jgi:hypothetical protein
VSDSDESYGGTHLLCYLQGVLLWSFLSANLIDMFPLALADVHPSKSPVVCLRDMLRVQKAPTMSLYAEGMQVRGRIARKAAYLQELQAQATLPLLCRPAESSKSQ